MLPRSRSIAALALAIVAFGSATASAQLTERASVDSAGAQSNGESSVPAISANGRFVAFASLASNLVANDTGGWSDVFVRDSVNGITQRVSVSTSGAGGSGDSTRPSISADGRFVAFASFAQDLVASDNNGRSDVFVRDRLSGTIEIASLANSGAQGTTDAGSAAISAAGRFVAFTTRASNIVPGDSNNSFDVFVRDRQNGTTERASIDSFGVQGNIHSFTPALSADARYVAFTSFATNLVAGDTNFALDAFVRDRQSGTTERVSVSTTGAQSDSHVGQVAISADGRFVAFDSDASTIVAGDTNGKQDVFVRDRQSGVTTRVSVGPNGLQLGRDSLHPSLSADGHFVAFSSDSSSLDASDANGARDVFVYDRTSGFCELASIATNGSQGDATSDFASLSADGRVAAFQSAATSLVPSDTNGVPDVFTRDRGALAPSTYCTAGTTSNGCAPNISASAHPSASFASPCTIDVTGVEGLKTGIVFYGIDPSFAPIPWAASSTSWLCVSEPAQRTPPQNSGGTFGACDGSYVLDWNAYQYNHPSALGQTWSIGARAFVQAWFRDPFAVKSTNLSNAVELTYLP